jgi:hypothetical protein
MTTDRAALVAKIEQWITHTALVGKHDDPCKVASEAAGLMRALLDAAPAQGWQEDDDYAWARERAVNMCASALLDAQVYRQKLLRGFGYPNETFARAQDYRALAILLARLPAPPTTEEK